MWAEGKSEHVKACIAAPPHPQRARRNPFSTSASVSIFNPVASDAPSIDHPSLPLPALQGERSARLVGEDDALKANRAGNGRTSPKFEKVRKFEFS